MGRRSRGTGPTTVVPVRLTKAEMALLDGLVAQVGKDRASVIRLGLTHLASCRAPSAQ